MKIVGDKMIAICPNCRVHEFQDQTYGVKHRVFNPQYKSGSRSILGYRCTVCGNKIGAPKEVKKEEKKEEKKK